MCGGAFCFGSLLRAFCCIHHKVFATEGLRARPQLHDFLTHKVTRASGFGGRHAEQVQLQVEDEQTYPIAIPLTLQALHCSPSSLAMSICRKSRAFLLTRSILLPLFCFENWQSAGCIRPVVCVSESVSWCALVGSRMHCNDFVQLYSPTSTGIESTGDPTSFKLWTL